MKLTSWGRYPRIQATGHSFETTEQLRGCQSRPGSRIVHAMGRSYGDSALSKSVIFTRGFDKILDFDPQTRTVTCESGVTLSELIETFLPLGWFLSVTPGTKFVSVGGAIASDVHGKNHHKSGCFSECVRAFELMLPDGKVVRCTREENQALFFATCGGMGLTGIILNVTLTLRPVQSAYVRETIIRCRNLEEVCALFEEHRDITYSVAWIDCLARNNDMGRSVLMLGEHARAGRLNPRLPKQHSVPFDLPGSCLNKHTVSLFNHFYYHKHPLFVEDRLVLLDTFFYPLDKVGHWNRIYGRGGFTQYQFVLPKEASLDGLKIILGQIASSGLGSFLGVIKLFGPENRNHLSFPMEGHTLALDFKIQAALFPLLDHLDRIVLDHGGRLYLTKDVRMTRDVFTKGYPCWEAFAELREKQGMKGRFDSLQSKRLGV